MEDTGPTWLRPSRIPSRRQVMTDQIVVGRVLVTGADIALGSLERLRGAGLVFEIEQESLGRAEIFDRLKGFRYYLYGGEEAADQLDRHEFAALAASGLQLIAFAGKGVHDFLRVPEAIEEGILVSNTPGAVEPSVAEFTVMLSLSLLRGALSRELDWIEGTGEITSRLTSPVQQPLGRDLADATVGIIGLGDIGSLVAGTLIKGYGTKIVYFSRTRKLELESVLGVTYKSLPELLRDSDVVSLHLPYGKETEALVASIPFEESESPVMLVNTASHKLFPADRLARLLEQGQIVSAAFDKIYSKDVIIESGLLSYVPNRLTVTNHSANASIGAWRRMTDMAVDSILAHSLGSLPPHGVTA
jgi:glyoxylate reductase